MNHTKYSIPDPNYKTSDVSGRLGNYKFPMKKKPKPHINYRGVKTH